MTPTIKALATFLPDGKSYVTELPVMEKPVDIGQPTGVYAREISEYQEHSRNRPRHPFPSCTPQQDGKEVEVRLQWQINNSEGVWENANEEIYQTYPAGIRRIIAIPASPAEQPGKEKGRAPVLQREPPAYVLVDGLVFKRSSGVEEDGDFQAECLSDQIILQISKNESGYIVTNAMNGYGQNTQKDYEDKLVTILYSTPISGNDDAAREEAAHGSQQDAWEWVALFYGALNELVELKSIKETAGKTDDYLERQPKAWYLAQEAIKLWGKSNFGASPLAGAAASQQGEVDEDEEHDKPYNNPAY
jgi:hypothetical protein